ncbi:MAG: DUF190 domain-containing protein [Bacteroidales bacterium]
MENNSKAVRLRIYISSTDKLDNTLLSEFLVHQANRSGLAGATALKGIMGFGASSIIHSYKFWEVSDKVPVVVEFVDEQDKVMAFFETIKPHLDKMRYGCLVTTELLNVLLYKTGEKKNVFS